MMPIRERDRPIRYSSLRKGPVSRYNGIALYVTCASYRREGHAARYNLYARGARGPVFLADLRIERGQAYTWYGVRPVGVWGWTEYGLPTCDPTFAAAKRALCEAVHAALPGYFYAGVADYAYGGSVFSEKAGGHYV